MTTSLTGELKIESQWSFTSTDAFSVTTENAQTATHTKTWSAGTGGSAIDRLWFDRRTITQACPTDDIDLAGVLTDVFGQTVTFAKIRELVIVNRTTTSGEHLKVGAAALNALSSLFDGSTTAKVVVQAGGALALTAPVDGLTVTAGSADVLRVLNAGVGSITYDIIIKGTSA